MCSNKLLENVEDPRCFIPAESWGLVGERADFPHFYMNKSMSREFNQE